MRRVKLQVEHLEDRQVPYTLGGTSWMSPSLTVSFVPDGTVLNDGATSWVLERVVDRQSPAGDELLARLRFVQQPEAG